MCCVLPRDCTELPSTENISCPTSAGVNLFSRAFPQIAVETPRHSQCSEQACAGEGRTEEAITTDMAGRDGKERQLLSWVHVAAQAVAQDTSWGCPLFLSACWMPRAALVKVMCPGTQCHQPHSLPISGGKQGQGFTRRWSQGALKTLLMPKDHWTFPCLHRWGYCSVELGSLFLIHPLEADKFFSSFTFFFFLNIGLFQ